jgi:ATP-dependent Clp protease ATP-binding subunit ClpA
MSEFKEASSVMELRDRLSKAKRAGKRFYLIDEIEKAHREVLDLLLQILDQGAELTAPDGDTIAFIDSYFVMTSNLGAREAMRSRTRNYTSFANTVREYVRRHLRPELLGRIEGAGGVLVFRRLEEPQQRELVGFHVAQVLERMRRSGHRLRMSPDAFERVIRDGFSEDHGARQLVGVIHRYVEGGVSDALRSKKATSGLLTDRADRQGLCVSEASEGSP